MKENWIDFKVLRQNLDFEVVLRHYHIEIKRHGIQHHGYCPLPNHQGKRNSPSFSANLERGIFQCFGCGSKGNVLEFAALMEKVDPRDGSQLKELALRLQQSILRTENGEGQNIASHTAANRTEGGKRQQRLINGPLDFELKGLDSTHPYLLNRGFTPETIGYFGLGYCSRGFLTNRVAIPLQDQQGRIIGYAGRVVDDSKISEANPRYRFPGERKRNDRVFEFRKSEFLYNGFRICSPLDDLIVVEGFASVWWLHQHGWKNVVAVMGADCSETQQGIIVSLISASGHLWLMPDGNAAGERLAQGTIPAIAEHRFVRWVCLPAGKQPTDFDSETLQKLLPRNGD